MTLPASKKSPFSATRSFPRHLWGTRYVSAPSLDTRGYNGDWTDVVLILVGLTVLSITDEVSPERLRISLLGCIPADCPRFSIKKKIQENSKDPHQGAKHN